MMVPILCFFMFSTTLFPIFMSHSTYELQENTYDWHQPNETLYPPFLHPRLIEEEGGNENIDEKYNLINIGDIESEVKAKLGEPESERNLTYSTYPLAMGPVPNIPNGTNYKQLTYDGRIKWIWIWLVSPNDYTNITGESTSSDEWLVIDKGIDDKNVMY